MNYVQHGIDYIDNYEATYCFIIVLYSTIFTFPVKRSEWPGCFGPCAEEETRAFLQLLLSEPVYVSVEEFVE